MALRSKQHQVRRLRIGPAAKRSEAQDKRNWTEVQPNLRGCMSLILLYEKVHEDEVLEVNKSHL